MNIHRRKTKDYSVLNIEIGEIKELYPIWDILYGFAGLKCNWCETKINALLEIPISHFKCPRCKANSIIVEEDYFTLWDKPEYGLKPQHIKELEDEMCNSFIREEDEYDTHPWQDNEEGEE